MFSWQTLSEVLIPHVALMVTLSQKRPSQLPAGHTWFYLAAWKWAGDSLGSSVPAPPVLASAWVTWNLQSRIPVLGEAPQKIRLPVSILIVILIPPGPIAHRTAFNFPSLNLWSSDNVSGGATNDFILSRPSPTSLERPRLVQGRAVGRARTGFHTNLSQLILHIGKF